MIPLPQSICIALLLWPCETMSAPQHAAYSLGRAYRLNAYLQRAYPLKAQRQRVAAELQRDLQTYQKHRLPARTDQPTPAWFITLIDTSLRAALTNV